MTGYTVYESERVSGRRAWKKLKAMQEGKHCMNKDEAKQMRLLKKKTGLSEEEIRNNPVYRKQLSEAQKKSQKGWGSRHSDQRILKRILKSVTQELKLPKEHPQVVKLFYKRCEEARNGHGFLWRLSSTVSYSRFPFQKQK